LSPTLQEHLQLARKTNEAVKKGEIKGTGGKTAR
jgi:hypothetical protein